MDEGERMTKWAYYGISTKEDDLKANLLEIETELKLRINNFPFAPWGRKQANTWDRTTNFIYRVSTWEDFKNKTNKFDDDLKNYAINRWFNFWSSKGVEQIFCNFPDVIPHKNKFDKLIDFTLKGIPFDHKSTVYPKRYKNSLNFAKENPQDLIEWLYKNQSREGRYHIKNRLFIIFFAHNGEHWKLKAELLELVNLITIYIQNFDKNNLIKLPQIEALSDIIWFEK